MTFYIRSIHRIKKDGGEIIKVLDTHSPDYYGFGEIYISTLEDKLYRPWKCHKIMTCNLVVISGAVEFEFKEAKDRDSVTSHTYAANSNVGIVIMPNTLFRFRSVASSASAILNIANIPHSEDEVDRSFN